nr:uncharacterized protein LOC113824963 isoform X2 [Penaeus vannamei]
MGIFPESSGSFPKRHKTYKEKVPAMSALLASSRGETRTDASLQGEEEGLNRPPRSNMADVDIDLYGDVEQDFTQDREMSWMTLLTETCMMRSSRAVEENGSVRLLPALPLPRLNVMEEPLLLVNPHKPKEDAQSHLKNVPSSLDQCLTVDGNISSTWET